MTEPIEPKHKEFMNLLARFLDTQLEGYGFTLLVFEFETSNGRINYISNAKREDMIVSMKEFIANCEGRRPPGGRA